MPPMHALIPGLYSLFYHMEKAGWCGGYQGGEEGGFLFKAAKGSRSFASSPPCIGRSDRGGTAEDDYAGGEMGAALP